MVDKCQKIFDMRYIDDKIVVYYFFMETIEILAEDPFPDNLNH